MFQLSVPQYVIDNLIRYMFEKYRNDLSNSVLIAQAFIFKYPDYGRDFCLSEIYKAIEYGMKIGLFQ
jgi:hypothetical protein